MSLQVDFGATQNPELSKGSVAAVGADQVNAVSVELQSHVDEIVADSQRTRCHQVEVKLHDIIIGIVG